MRTVLTKATGMPLVCRYKYFFWIIRTKDSHSRGYRLQMSFVKVYRCGSFMNYKEEVDILEIISMKVTMLN
uniref:Ovule protein n=1 Tax=Strongyloides venezuelensis TaxID=75913 RepID=A0A0K0FB95_STRVS